MSEAERVAPGPAAANLFNPVPSRQARLRLAQGDLAAATRWTQQRGLCPDDEPPYPREPEYLVLARVLLAQDQPGRALALLERLHAAAVSQGRTGSVIEAGALQALALVATGEEAAAVDALADVLTLACPQGYVRVFADEGPQMAALLGALVAAQRDGQAAAARGVPLGCLARVLRAFGATDAMEGSGRGAAVAVPGLAEQLTARELEVLALLAAGAPKPADRRGTGGHPGHGQKTRQPPARQLGAANRTEAVIRARQLGLIP
jgi:ATP/maltotriose-dependent transcriptional regulator MalT